MTEKTTKLLLKEALLNADGTIHKDGQFDKRTQEELTKMNIIQIMKEWPPFTIGNALLGMINNTKNIENIEQVATLHRLLVKIKNKMNTNKGEWNIEKSELLDLKAFFDSMDPKN